MNVMVADRKEKNTSVLHRASLLPFTQYFIHFVPGVSGEYTTRLISAWREALSKREKKEEELKNLELSCEFQ